MVEWKVGKRDAWTRAGRESLKEGERGRERGKEGC